FFFSSKRRHTRFSRDWSSDVCSSDLPEGPYNKMIGLKVVGSAMTVRDYRNEKEQAEHARALEEADNRMEGEFKGKKREKKDNTRSEERRVGKECRTRGQSNVRTKEKK